MYCPDVRIQQNEYIKENTNTSSKLQRDVSLLKKIILVSRNELRETKNIGATDLDELIANFLRQVCEFLFLICVKKTISMKILVLRVINSSRHRNCFVRGYIRELFLTQTTREYNPVRRTFYDVNYIYSTSRHKVFIIIIFFYH